MSKQISDILHKTYIETLLRLSRFTLMASQSEENIEKFANTLVTQYKFIKHVSIQSFTSLSPIKLSRLGGNILIIDQNTTKEEINLLESYVWDNYQASTIVLCFTLAGYVNWTKNASFLNESRIAEYQDDCLNFWII